jgi:1,4-alpha-glucan branching enzyme
MASNLGKKRVTFNIRAPNAREKAVAGTFNNWDPSTRTLKKETDGNWEVTFYLSPGKYEYRFVVDGIGSDEPHCSTRCRNQYGGKNYIVEVR